MMMRFVILCTAIMAVLVESKPYVSRERRGLAELFNSQVVYAEFVARKSSSGKGYNHYGVVVTTNKGERWLVHKGNNFSRHSDTVVTSAKHMSQRWKLIKKIKVKGVRIKDYLKIAGKYFHPHFDNAFHAAKRMIKIGRVEHDSH